MLPEGVETGYEGKFDFPKRDAPPESVYMLATVPRTGSTYFSHLLWQTGCLGAPLEYLNFEEAGPYGFASRSPELQHRLWQSALQRRSSPNGVFGLKCFPMQLQALAEGNPALLGHVWKTLLPSERPPRVVYLARRDRAAHLISYARATLSGVWRKEQEGEAAPEVPFSERALERAGQWIDSQTEAWEQMFRELRLEPLRLWYEDAVERPDEAVAQVARYLGVVIRPEAAVRIPEVRKQSDEDARAWAARLSQAPPP